jgi:methionine aminotransferase
MPGFPALREIIAKVIFETYQHQVNPDTDITVTAGATQAIYATISALVSAGDEVILFDPAYDCYNPAIRLNGGTPVHINLKLPNFSIDWEEVKSKITSRTKMIMVNTPQNPSGAVFTAEDLKSLEEIAENHDLIVLSDEVYERIIFDGLPHLSVLGSPTLAKRSIAIFSFGKTFHATGWKTGYAVAPPEISREIRKAHQFITFSVNTAVQAGLAVYMENPNHYTSLHTFFQQKRDFFLEQIKGSRFEVLPCHGSYFQLLSYASISDKSDFEMAEELTKKHGVASIPISVFYQDKSDNKILRFCFAKSEEVLEKAGRILRGI